MDSFWYKTIFAQSSSPHIQSDAEFYGESYDAQDVTGFYWVQKFYTENPEKVEKIMNIQEYPKKIHHFSALLNMCFHMNMSELKYQCREKTSKNFGGEPVVILAINLTAILAIQRSFSYWTATILVITPKVGVELVIHQLVQFSVSFLPVSD